VRRAALALAALAGLAAPRAAMAAYARAGIAWEASADAGFKDEACGRPGAAFGCGAGLDGRPFAARGDFGRTAAVEFGLGERVLPFLRLEAVAAWRPGLAFEGRAATPAGAGAVRSDLDSLAGFVAAYADVGGYGRARPFLGLGVGAARNRLGPLPLPAGATRAGARVEPAWMAAAGVAWIVSPTTTVEAALRHVDLGRVGSGGAAPVRSAVRADGVSLALRRRF
jgi:hypothetical protein